MDFKHGEADMKNTQHEDTFIPSPQMRYVINIPYEIWTSNFISIQIPLQPRRSMGGSPLSPSRTCIHQKISERCLFVLGLVAWLKVATQHQQRLQFKQFHQKDSKFSSPMQEKTTEEPKIGC